MTDEVKRREGMTYVCKIPEEMDAVTKIEIKRGKVVVRTESGQTMIVPRSRVAGQPPQEAR